MSSTTTTSANNNNDEMFDCSFPSSVEEAGALLGAAIMKCNVTSLPSVMPPKGMHSSFATLSPVPSSELFSRLYQLRELLRNMHTSNSTGSASKTPLVAAPSLLAVLMKLLGVSSSLAPQFMLDARVPTPPLWSTPLRTLWVDSVVLCHVLGEDLTGKARIDIYAFTKNMVALAGLNPKSSKAAGGTRMAGLQVICGLFENLAMKLSPWAWDVLHLCSKSLKSSGNGEPSYRIAACRTATAVAVACRTARRTAQQNSSGTTTSFLVAGAMEDRALVEALKLLKQATTDKFPEVRFEAAQFCAALAPLLVQTPRPGDSSTASTITSSLDDCMSLAFKNLDDESTRVALAWAEALARCMCTAIAHHAEQKEATPSRTNGGGGGGDEPEEAMRYSRSSSSSNTKTGDIVSNCTSLPKTVQYLVESWFLKVGGELAASRMGGPFSVGGRAVRSGIACVLVQLLRIHQATPGVIGVEYPLKQLLQNVLHMVGPDLKLLRIEDASSSSSSSQKRQAGGGGGGFFGGIVNKNRSAADAGLARLATGRVLRQGVSEICAEGTQLAFLHELTALCCQGTNDSNNDRPLNAQQLQVALIEMSHLLSTLGQAAGGFLQDDLIPLLQNSLRHPDHGVRHEAAVAWAALASSFPQEARKQLRQSIEEIQVQHAELVTQATIDEGKKPVVPAEKKSRFARRTTTTKEEPQDKSVHFQYSIHGHALLIALLLRELSQLPGGLPTESLAMSMSVGEILVTCQYIDILTNANATGACTCVRAGYGIICGALTLGPTAMEPHIALLFGLWQRGNEKNKNFTPNHDLICLDAALTSVVAFLEHCSELLLVIPDALSQTTIMLEQLLPKFMNGGSAVVPPKNDAVATSRHESAKASLLEAFAWLPPGSFPMIANDVFSFALSHVQSGTESDVMSSLLPSLINKEDLILDAKSLCRAQRYDQVGGGRDIDENYIVMLSEATHPGERESVLQLQSSSFRRRSKDDDNDDTDQQLLWQSRILGLFAYDGIDLSPLPTPLHEVGTWRKPVSPSSSSKVRLVDAAIQAFSATFGLKDGKEQQNAMQILEQMVPPLLAQLARTMGVIAISVNEVDRRSKPKDDVAAVANITAVLLACLKALPLHEATHDIPIGLGPPWMNKAKDLLLTLLPSASNVVRRAAAEGLALLATLGVTEDAHTLQSSVLHSLDEVMQGNKPDGKRNPIPIVEPVSAARAGSLLTLGCIQRTAHNIKMIHRARNKGRGTSTSESVATAQRDALPTMQMMTRILPSIACHAIIRDAFVPRTYGLFAFDILLAYSVYQKEDNWTAEDEHLLKKAIESVEDNFLSCWTAISSDMDGEQGPEKLAAEVSFLAVILRMMTTLIPYLDEATTARFNLIANMVSEEAGKHPVVLVEAMSFFEVLAKQQQQRSSSVHHLPQTVQQIFDTATPAPPSVFADSSTAVVSSKCAEAGSVLLRMSTSTAIGNNQQHQHASSLYGLLNTVVGSRPCTSESLFRCLAAPREVDEKHAHHLEIEKSIISALAACTNNHCEMSLPFMANHHRWQIRAVATTFITQELRRTTTTTTTTAAGLLTPTKVSELLLAACAAVVATSETYELGPVQQAGAELLTVLVESHGQVRDPAEPDSLLMEQYSSQILASVKHSVTLPGGDENDYKLFCTGCKTLEALIKKGVICDASSFKRLVRPVLPTAADVAFCKLGATENPFRAKPILSHVTKLATMARIAALIDNQDVSAEVTAFLPDTTKTIRAELAIHCAAVALDSWRLTTTSQEEEDAAGFFYGNAQDLDHDMKSVLLKAGPPCLCYAMICLSKIKADESVDEEKRADCNAWLEVLLPLAFVAFHNATTALSGKMPDDDSKELPPSESTAYYLHGLRSVIQSCNIIDDLAKGGVAELTSKVSTAILYPALGIGLKVAGGNAKNVSDTLVSEACKFLEVVAASTSISSETESAVLVALVTPLDAIQRKVVSLEAGRVINVVASHINAMRSLIEQGTAKSSLVNAMLEFSTEILSRSLTDASLTVAAESMLGTCLSDESITLARQQTIAQEMAKHGKWKAWAIIGTQCPGALTKSLSVAATAIENVADSKGHVEALAAVRTILQSADPSTNPVVGILFQGVGGSCLGLFKAYANLALPTIKDLETNRMSVCADSMKIIMASYQCVVATAPDNVGAYLSIVFDALIDVIQFNGLPNQASPQVGANPVFGRLAAQAIVHVARTTPVAFKETVGTAMESPQKRAILEFAVRAEMSGYATAGPAPEKKKLNLKSFKK